MRAAHDPTPRIAVISAFEPELIALEAMVEDRHSATINGVTFITGKMALDRFAID